MNWRFTKPRPRPIAFALLLTLIALPILATPPIIDYQPQPQTNIIYQQAAFGVIAHGTSPKEALDRGHYLACSCVRMPRNART